MTRFEIEDGYLNFNGQMVAQLGDRHIHFDLVFLQESGFRGDLQVSKTFTERPYHLDIKIGDNQDNLELLRKQPKQDIPEFEEKNVVEKFKAFFEPLSATEQRDLYDILALLRGPDQDGGKHEFTARIRYILGVIGRSWGTKSPGGCYPTHNRCPFPSYEESIELAEERTTGHYRFHVRGALESLHELGIIKS